MQLTRLIVGFDTSQHYSQLEYDTLHPPRVEKSCNLGYSTNLGDNQLLNFFHLSYQNNLMDELSINVVLPWKNSADFWLQHPSLREITSL